MSVFSISLAPQFEVRIISVFLKDTTRPLESVKWPSSRTCNIRLKTSGCAFSTSSKRTRLYGFLRTASVSWLSSSYPTYPGGLPISFATVCFSMNSLISKRTMESSMPKYASANALQSSVFPTPVGPQKMKDAMGLLGFCSPARARRTAFAMATTASSWPITRLCSVSSRWTSRTDSSAVTFSTGTFVQADTTAATSFSVTVGFDSASSMSSSLKGGSSTSFSASFADSWSDSLTASLTVSGCGESACEFLVTW
mmetsp:Transcript_39172/g.91814  ORF Transcript_39172/g.91814 Transcript_39172/m.91814 type:complete len:254 (+) Transcript_39172:747-1508(+)